MVPSHIVIFRVSGAAEAFRKHVDMLSKSKTRGHIVLRPDMAVIAIKIGFDFEVIM
jgi:hypothetical protein